MARANRLDKGGKREEEKKKKQKKQVTWAYWFKTIIRNPLRVRIHEIRCVYQVQHVYESSVLWSDLVHTHGSTVSVHFDRV